jgi:hypothetical protein
MKTSSISAIALSILFASAPLVHAQLTLNPLPSGPGYPVSDAATEVNSDISASSETVGGLAGGFDPNLALAPDLQQQVSSSGGLPLENNAISTQYTNLWPGYTNANYNQNPAYGSPEADMAITLGTLEGSLQAAANQQASQTDELNRLEALETESAAATGLLQILEVNNEAELFAAEQDMKLRNAINSQLNALNVVESNRQNQEAQDQMGSLAIASEHAAWDATNDPSPAEMPPIEDYPSAPITGQVTE